MNNNLKVKRAGVCVCVIVILFTSKQVIPLGSQRSSFHRGETSANAPVYSFLTPS